MVELDFLRGGQFSDPGGRRVVCVSSFWPSISVKRRVMWVKTLQKISGRHLGYEVSTKGREDVISRAEAEM